MVYRNKVSFQRGAFSFKVGCECAWETDIYVRDPVGFKINVINFISITLPLFETGTFPVAMHLFKDDSYSLQSMYNEPPTFEIPNSPVSYMYVGIRHVEPLVGVNLQILSLWATPDSDPSNFEKYQLVQDQCPLFVEGNKGRSS